MSDALSSLQQELLKQWYTTRKQKILEKITAGDVLQRFGVTLKYGGARKEQVHCPFHGPDNSPSAKYYPDEVDNSSHLWCWVCKKRWDVVGVWSKFNSEKPFSAVLAEIERAYSLEVPPLPKELKNTSLKEEQLKKTWEMFDMVENRLRTCKRSFELKGYLLAGYALDRLRYQLTKGQITSETALTVLKQLLTKIGDKERAASNNPHNP